MRKDQVHVGHTYIAKISDKLTRVRIDGENAHGGWDATNLGTNKKVRIKSPAKLRGPAPDHQAKQRTKAVAETQAADAAANTHAVNPDVVPLAEAMKPAKATKAARAKKTPAEPKAKKPSGLDAAAQVLKDAGKPMRCKDMVDTMLANGLWKTDGKTPAATIYAAILREIQTKGSEARFKKTDRGLFTINA
jgi:hypothetical protein